MHNWHEKFDLFLRVFSISQQKTIPFFGWGPRGRGGFAHINVVRVICNNFCKTNHDIKTKYCKANWEAQLVQKCHRPLFSTTPSPTHKLTVRNHRELIGPKDEANQVSLLKLHWPLQSFCFDTYYLHMQYDKQSSHLAALQFCMISSTVLISVSCTWLTVGVRVFTLLGSSMPSHYSIWEL